MCNCKTMFAKIPCILRDSVSRFGIRKRLTPALHALNDLKGDNVMYRFEHMRCVAIFIWIDVSATRAMHITGAPPYIGQIRTEGGPTVHIVL